MSEKILVAYYSWGGSTRRLAEAIHAAAGAELFEILPQAPYPTDYNICVTQAKKEIQAEYKPELKTKIKDIGSFDILFIGSPNWWSSIAPPVATFLSENDFTGKTVAPFCTHGGGGQGHILKDIAKLCPRAKVLNCLAAASHSLPSTGELSAWLKQAGVDAK
jgi:flavodoxin